MLFSCFVFNSYVCSGSKELDTDRIVIKMIERIGWIIFYICIALFIYNESLRANELTWSEDLTLREYSQAGHVVGYKVFFKITENCQPESDYNYSVDVGDQTSLDLFGNDYLIPGRNYKFQIKSYAVINQMVYESKLSEVVGCFKPRPLTGIETLKLEQQKQGLKKKSLTKEKQ